MELYDIKISKKQLEAMTDDERNVSVQFGHACNELVFLNKLLLMVSDTSTTELEGTAMVAQSMIVIRFFAGKTFETWELVRKNYLSNRLSKKYSPNLDEEGTKALAYIKKVFWWFKSPSDSKKQFCISL